MFAAAIIACTALLLLLDVGAVAAILCMTVITGSMHGVNWMLVSHVPKRFRKCGNVSTVSGVIDAFTYVGAAIATYGIARISEPFGWQITIIL